MKLDILVIAAHPDDAELGCGGTIAGEIARGKKVGVLDLTRGELGTRGTPEIRDREADIAAQKLGLSIRENMGFRDGLFDDDEIHRLALVKKIRQFRPEIIITNAPKDRHPDHGRSASLVVNATWLARLPKIGTILEGSRQEPWKTSRLFHFIQSSYLEPDFIVDISQFWDQKRAAIEAYESQFYSPESAEPETFISSSSFMKLIEGRAIEFGIRVGVKYGEGFLTERTPAVKDLFHLI